MRILKQALDIPTLLLENQPYFPSAMRFRTSALVAIKDRYRKDKLTQILVMDLVDLLRTLNRGIYLEILSDLQFFTTSRTR